MISRELFRGVRDIVMGNPTIQQPRRFHDWISDNYFIASMVGIRRLIDINKNTISFQRLLMDIQKRCALVTRNGFVRRYPKWMRDKGIADEHFDSLAGIGLRHLPVAIPKADIEQMVLQARNVKDFVDKRVAHWDRKAGKLRILKTPEIDAALDAIDKTSVKYYLLLTGTYLDPMGVEAWSSEWKGIFLTPWINEKFPSPNYGHGVGPGKR